MADKTNTTKIEELQELAGNLVARLDVHDVRLGSIIESLKKYQEATEGHNAKIIVVEQQLLVLVDLKSLVVAVATIDKDLALLRKDVEGLGKWKEDLKKERDEKARRWWAFGPNITAALISIIGSGIVMALNYWFNKPR